MGDIDFSGEHLIIPGFQTSRRSPRYPHPFTLHKQTVIYNQPAQPDDDYGTYFTKRDKKSISLKNGAVIYMYHSGKIVLFAHMNERNPTAE